MKKSILLVLASLFVISCSSTVAKENTMEKTNKEKAVELLRVFETRSDKPIEYINPNKYIQHNLGAADGVEGFKALIASLPPSTAKTDIVRVIEDGNYVITHSIDDSSEPTVGFDIFKFENGKIVEHWDNLQAAVAKTPSGHTMIDGATEIKDLDKTKENKELVEKFVMGFLVNGDMTAVDKYLDSTSYVQHNPGIADNVEGLQQALKYFMDNKISFKYDKVHMILGEGNFVLTVSEGEIGGVHSSFYDLFRVENGKIVEHWDTIEAIPSKENWKNTNGKF
jgi:predicted SnoaL-like aldol condensation-catalyzing enzyme